MWRGWAEASRATTLWRAREPAVRSLGFRLKARLLSARSSFHAAYYETSVGFCAFVLAFRIYDLFRLRTSLVSDQFYVRQNFKRRRGRTCDLEKPRTFNEKLQWLKLHDRSSLHTRCADKLAVRGYVAERVGRRYLVPLVAVLQNAKNLSASLLPAAPVIIKTNHDSAGGVIVDPGRPVNWKRMRKRFSRRLRENYYLRAREWQYRHIEPCILIEDLLVEGRQGSPVDYKIYCLNGRARWIQVDVGRGERHVKYFYDCEWSPAPFVHAPTPARGDGHPKPASLTEMLWVAERLAEPFRFVRVDLYNLDGRILFGEMTFHPHGGWGTFEPPEWDLKLGSELDLAIA